MPCREAFSKSTSLLGRTSGALVNELYRPPSPFEHRSSRFSWVFPGTSLQGFGDEAESAFSRFTVSPSLAQSLLWSCLVGLWLLLPAELDGASVIRLSLLVCLFLLAIGMGRSIAAPPIGSDIPASEQSSIIELGPTLSPFQHVRFCQRYPSDCRPGSQVNALVELDGKTAGLLYRINRKINAAIIPTRKDVLRGAAWAIAPNSGDCNDYAVTKQHELLQYKLPANALRLSEVKTVDGEGHLVLVVATTKEIGRAHV